MIFSTNGPKWISIPIIKSSRDTIIKDIKINNKIDWQSQHKKIIFEIYKESKYYSKVINIFENVFIKKWESLAELNIYIIKKIIKNFNLKTKIVLSSELNIDKKKSELILEICNYFNIKEYITGLGSKKYLQEKYFQKKKIDIRYMTPINKEYNQVKNYIEFMPNLSILDYIFCNGFDKSYLK